MADEKLENRVAVITGSSRGIGYAVSVAFALEGPVSSPLPDEIAALAVSMASDESSSIAAAAIDAFFGWNPLFE